jgi:DNA-binding protein H-NS
MATYLELRAQAEKLLAQAEELRAGERVEAIRDMKEKIAAYDVSAQELGFAFGSSPRKSSAIKGKSPAAKYKGPNGELWSGRGRQPKWMVSALAAGKKVDEFRI